MTPGEQVYLAMVIIALCVFGVTLAYASIIAGNRIEKRHRETAPHTSSAEPEYKKAA